MSIEFIGVAALICGLCCLLWFDRFKFDLLMLATLLGSSAALVFPTLAISIQPAHLLLAIFLLALLASDDVRRHAFEAFGFGAPGFWLLAAMIYGASGALLFPRLFSGVTYVNAIGVTAAGFSFVPTPLGPASGNLTQTIYFVGDLAMFAITYAWAQDKRGRHAFQRALIVYAAGNIIFALADIVTFWTGTGFLLDFMRNAAYTMHNETVVYDLKRIVGSFTEASAFAYASIGALAAMLSLWLDGVKPRLTLPLALTTFILLMLSTSSTAYGATPIVLGVMFCAAVLRTIYGRVTTQTVAFILFTPLLLGLAVLALLQMPNLLEIVARYADVLVLDKSNSASAIERSEWNATALRNFYDTYGLGVGVGSARASSFPLAVLANLGAFGALTYGIFLAKILSRGAAPAMSNDDAASYAAARWSCFALLVASSVSGALIDLGLPFFITAGFASAQRSKMMSRYRPLLAAKFANA